MSTRHLIKANEMATHEAGHAVASAALKIGFVRVRIDPDGLGGKVVIGKKARTEYKQLALRGRSDPEFIDYVERWVVTDLAGACAQRRYAPRSDWRYVMGHVGVRELHYGDGNVVSYVRAAYGSDLAHVRNCFADLGYYGEARDAYQSKLETRAKALVKQLWPEIKIVATELLKRRTLTYAEVRRLMEQTEPPQGLTYTQQEKGLTR